MPLLRPVMAQDASGRSRGSAGGARTVVVGAGLGGLAAAVRLAERGLPVTVVETRKRIGGRATSFIDPSMDQVLDNCQHVLLGCYANLMDLYGRLGVVDRIRWDKSLYFAGEDGRIDELGADDLPAPLHLLRGFWRFGMFSFRQKLAITRGMLALTRISARRRQALDDRSFADWLRSARQPQSVIEKFWSVIIVSACNERPERVSARYAVQVFQEGFLDHEQAYEMGLSAVPLVELYEPAEQVLARRGGRLMLSASATRIGFDGRRMDAVELVDGRRLECEFVVVAVPFDRLLKLCDARLFKSDPRLSPLERLGFSPIIGIHLYLRRADGEPVMELPHLVLTQSPLQWVFNKGPARLPVSADPAAAGGVPPVQHLHGVISAAHDLAPMPADLIISMAVAELRRALPAAVDAELVHSRVIKEKRATLSIRPGVDRLRPATTGPVRNLFLAGDWCDTGWPATMEGAVRSGYSAAAAVIESLGAESDGMLADDLRPGLVYRFLNRALAFGR